MNGLLGSLLTTDAHSSVAAVAVTTVLLSWWLGVVALTLRARRVTRRS